MTSKEIVKSSLDFSGPIRIPMCLPAPYSNDFVSCGIRPEPGREEGQWQDRNGREERVDVWGNTWARLGGISKGEVVRGALEDGWDALDGYKFPRFDLPEQYESARQTFAQEPEKFALGGLPGFPFSIARKLRRMENFLMDILLERANVVRLLDSVADRLEEAISGLVDAGADGIVFAEDWGTQDRLLVSPKDWRELFKPGFRRLCDVAHSKGAYVFMHSCGYIYDIIEDLIEVGVDVLQFDQPQLYGIDLLNEEFGGRVNFWCPVDIQKTLQTRNAELIEEDAREMIEKLGGHNGGFMAKSYSDNKAIGLDPKWQDIAFRAFEKYGRGRCALGAV